MKIKPQVINGQIDIFGQTNVNVIDKQIYKEILRRKQEEEKRKREKKIEVDQGRLDRNAKMLERIEGILCCFKIEKQISVYDGICSCCWITKRTTPTLEALLYLAPEERNNFMDTLPESSLDELDYLMKHLFS